MSAHGHGRTPGCTLSPEHFLDPQRLGHLSSGCSAISSFRFRSGRENVKTGDEEARGTRGGSARRVHGSRFERSEKELMRVADARPRARATRGAFAEPLRDLRRSGRVERKARNGRLDAASTLVAQPRTAARVPWRSTRRIKPFPMTAASLATTRVRGRSGSRPRECAAAARSRVMSRQTGVPGTRERGSQTPGRWVAQTPLCKIKVDTGSWHD